MANGDENRYPLSLNKKETEAIEHTIKIFELPETVPQFVKRAISDRATKLKMKSGRFMHRGEL